MMPDVETYKSRAELRKNIIEAFAAQDEVYRICFFGREAEGKQDGYSDIDLVVFSNDLASTQKKYRGLFSAISPLRSTFQLEATAYQYSEMVQLKEYSPYQKVDFSIFGTVECSWNFVVAYEDKGKARASLTRLESQPILRDINYLVTDVLFSVARFTKCLFRQDLDMYRRWVSISEVALALLYEKHFGWEPETDRTRLGSSGINRLYNDLDPFEKALANTIRPPDGRLDIALSYQVSIELIIELSRKKAEHAHIPLDFDFVEYIRKFMHEELARYRDKFRLD